MFSHLQQQTVCGGLLRQLLMRAGAGVGRLGQRVNHVCAVPGDGIVPAQATVRAQPAARERREGGRWSGDGGVLKCYDGGGRAAPRQHLLVQSLGQVGEGADSGTCGAEQPRDIAGRHVAGEAGAVPTKTCSTSNDGGGGGGSDERGSVASRLQCWCHGVGAEVQGGARRSAAGDGVQGQQTAAAGSGAPL